MPHSLFAFLPMYFYFAMPPRRRNQVLTLTTIFLPIVRAYGITIRRIYTRNQTEGAFKASRKE